jgi:hypothetical protein
MAGRLVARFHVESSGRLTASDKVPADGMDKRLN